MVSRGMVCSTSRAVKTMLRMKGPKTASASWVGDVWALPEGVASYVEVGAKGSESTTIAGDVPWGRAGVGATIPRERGGAGTSEGVRLCECWGVDSPTS